MAMEDYPGGTQTSHVVANGAAKGWGLPSSRPRRWRPTVDQVHLAIAFFYLAMAFLTGAYYRNAHYGEKETVTVAHGQVYEREASHGHQIFLSGVGWPFYWAGCGADLLTRWARPAQKGIE